jgi:hypothetical protein
MVVHNLDVMCLSRLPPKAEPPLIVNADAVLAGSIPSQLLQSVARRTSEIVRRLGSVQDHELAQGGPLNRQRPSAHPLALEDPLGVLIPEAPYHSP